MNELSLNWSQLIDYAVSAMHGSEASRSATKSTWNRFVRLLGVPLDAAVDLNHFSKEKMLEYRKQWQLPRGSDSSVFSRARDLGEFAAEWQRAKPGALVSKGGEKGLVINRGLFDEIRRLRRAQGSTWDEVNEVAGFHVKQAARSNCVYNLRPSHRRGLENLEHFFRKQKGHLLSLWAVPDKLRWEDSPRDVVARIRAGEYSGCYQAIRALLFANTLTHADMTKLTSQYDRRGKMNPNKLAAVDKLLGGEGSLIELSNKLECTGKRRNEEYSLGLSSWPHQMQDDWADLLEYKTVNHRQRPRHDQDAKWNSPYTIENVISRCELFFGWCCVPKSQGGGGYASSCLDLTMLLDTEMFAKYDAWYNLRNRRRTSSEGLKIFINQVLALCRDKSTYFFVEIKRYSDRQWLADKMPSGDWEEPTDDGHFFGGTVRKLKTTSDRYRAYLMEVRARIHRFVASRRFGGGALTSAEIIRKMEQTRELSLDALKGAYVQAYRELPPRECMPIRWALAVRNLAIFGMMTVRPLRSRTFRELQLIDIREDHGIWHFQIDVSRMKAGDCGGSKGGHKGRVPDIFPFDDPVVGMYSLHRLLGIYMEAGRKILLRGRESVLVFPALTRIEQPIGGNGAVDGKPMSISAMYCLMREFCKKYVDTASGPHAMRYIFGTNGRRAGWSFDDIALGLQNTAEMVKKTYERTVAEDRGERATAMIEKLSTEQRTGGVNEAA